MQNCALLQEDGRVWAVRCALYEDREVWAQHEDREVWGSDSWRFLHEMCTKNCHQTSKMSYLKRNFHANLVTGGLCGCFKDAVESVWNELTFCEACIFWVAIATMKSGWTELTLCATLKCIFTLQAKVKCGSAPFLASSQMPQKFPCNPSCLRNFLAMAKHHLPPNCFPLIQKSEMSHDGGTMKLFYKNNGIL